jgi:hypothetical protein
VWRAGAACGCRVGAPVRGVGRLCG